MNPTAADPVPPPPQPPQPHRSSFSCDRHPDEQFTGFCPSCLCERLTTLDQSSSNSNNNPSASSSRRNSTSAAAATAAAALKSLFSKPSTSSASTANLLPPKPSKQPTTSSSSSFFPELRRTKSFSASKNDSGGLNFSASAFEPQRKSCDVRVRNTLWSLFTLDNKDARTTATSAAVVVTTSAAASSSSQTHHPRNIVNEVFVNRPVFESKEEEEEENGGEEEEVEETEEEYKEIENIDNNVVDQISEVQQQPRISCSEIVEEEIGNGSSFTTATKPMKDHIDNESQAKKASGGGVKEIAGSFWLAASGFSKKWNNWRRKQKLKKQNGEENSATLPVEKPLSRQYRETQSEVADYGFGRRSCDTDPRFSLDAGRISFDDPRYSFDEPRASWDGYIIGRTYPRMHPLVENAPVVNIPRPDMQIPVEEPQMVMNCIDEDENVPGGSAQTRDYYADSSSRRRKSFDRSNSIRKTAAAVVAEIDEMKAVPNANAKVSPATVDSFHGAKVLGGERDLRDSNSNSLRDDSSEIVGLGSLRDNASAVGNGERKGSKKSRRWSWNIWGFIHRRSSGNKDEDDERYSRANGVERSFSESWQDLRREGNGEVRGGLNRRVLRSNSSVSWRNSSNFGGSFGSARKSGAEMNGHGKKRDEFVLERNRSARYSPTNDNGLLRFYLTPMRSSRRGAPAKNRLNGSHSISRSVLRLY